MKIADNHLLLGSILVVAIYWAVGTIAPWAPFAAVVNVALVVGSGLLLLRFAPDAAAILFRGRRNEDAPDGDGSHLAVYGMTLIALGGVITAITAFMMGMPSVRLLVHQTPLGLFGRSMASAGLLLVFFSPSVTRRGVQFNGGLWVYLVAAIVMLGVYSFGYNAGYQSDHQPGAIEDTSHIPADRPRCSLERPILGNTDRMVYHTLASPHRKLITDFNRCFTSVEEAEENGFRAPG